MKYIRTKDGHVCELMSDIDSKSNNVKVKVYDTYGFVSKVSIIKQADTIEELCDGFIFKDTHANELHFLDKNSGISLLGASLFEETLRGFVETDKGLIYVAKMNDKGELELL